jgi:ubiquinone/menaquinone biosynthesis C-methylase UbiE
MTAFIANIDMAQAWDGQEGDHWTQHEERYNATIPRHTSTLLAAAAISPHDHVLDIGCGCGESTRLAARTALQGAALGVDLSSRMIERATERSRAEGLANVRFLQADAQVYPFDQQAFDVAISRFGAMFFADPIAAFQNIARALRPGALMALLSWQDAKKNEWVMAFRSVLAAGRDLPEPTLDAPGPFGLASPSHVCDVLSKAGFNDIDLKEINEPMFFGANASNAFEFLSSAGMTQGMLKDLDESARTLTLGDLRAVLASHETDSGVLFDSRAWLITARRS